MIGARLGVAALSGGTPPNPNFVSTWDTTQAGSASDTIVLPMTAGNTVHWGDGSSDTTNTHTYASSGTYTITIEGAVNTFRFANSGDKAKILEISNWGGFDIYRDRIFQTCTNLDITATDYPLLSNSLSAFATFRQNSITNVDFSTWDFSLCTNFTYFLRDNSDFTGRLEGIIHAGVTIIGGAFEGCGLLGDQDLSTWDVSGVTDWSQVFYNAKLGANSDVSNWIVQGNMTRTFTNNISFEGNGLPTWNIVGLTGGNATFVNTNITTANYDALLVSWEAQAPPNAVAISFGAANYTIGSAAEAARTSLIITYGWTITDGGGI